jgi:hypothetical protein
MFSGMKLLQVDFRYADGNASPDSRAAIIRRQTITVGQCRHWLPDGQMCRRSVGIIVAAQNG